MRPVLSSFNDFNNPFLLSVYASTRDEEMRLAPWTDEQKTVFLKTQFEAQHDYYLQKFPDASYQIINFDKIPVGRLYVLRLKSEIRILDLTVLPEFRGKGIGTYLISELCEEAAAAGKALQIYIESFNSSSELFSRLGFVPVGEQGVHILWEWRQAEKSAAAIGA